MVRKFTLGSLLFASLVTAATPTFAQRRPKVTICHFSEEDGFWVRIRISERAAIKHLQRHDDALPGDVTSFTGIPLDDNCMPVTP